MVATFGLEALDASSRAVLHAEQFVQMCAELGSAVQGGGSPVNTLRAWYREERHVMTPHAVPRWARHADPDRACADALTLRGKAGRRVDAGRRGEGAARLRAGALHVGAKVGASRGREEAV